MKKHKKYKRHFRIYLVNNHPAYIVGEDEFDYIFHRTTESTTSGGKKNWPISPNPLKNHNGRRLFIVKMEQIDNKKRFSLFEIEIREGFNIDYPNIKLKKDIKK